MLFFKYSTARFSTFLGLDYFTEYTCKKKKKKMHHFWERSLDLFKCGYVLEII